MKENSIFSTIKLGQMPKRNMKFSRSWQIFADTQVANPFRLFSPTNDHLHSNFVSLSMTFDDYRQLKPRS